MVSPTAPGRPGGEPARPRIFGLLGGIASGKSEVARLLAGAEGRVVDADREARRVLEEPEVRSQIARAFGPEVLDERGAVRRDVLARAAFADAEARARLESLTHPRIRARVRTALADAESAGVPRIVLDVPLLVENADRHGLLERCDELWYVDASAELRDARAVAGRGWPPGEVARREGAQRPLSEKRALADVVIVNDGTPAELAAAVRAALARNEPH